MYRAQPIIWTNSREMPNSWTLPGESGLLCGICKEGNSCASRCFALWMAAANWMVPASIKRSPGVKLSLQACILFILPVCRVESAPAPSCNGLISGAIACWAQLHVLDCSVLDDTSVSSTVICVPFWVAYYLAADLSIGNGHLYACLGC